MSLIGELPKLLDESRKEYEAIMPGTFKITEISGKQECDESAGRDINLMCKSDNLAFMKYLITEKNMAGKVNLIYIDPPFFSKSSYDAVIKLESETMKQSSNVKVQAYQDIWEKGLYEYLKMLTVRFYMMKDLLADEGCFWVHLDWHVVHYVKIILDEIFGEKNFVNEIIWQYKSGGTSKKHFSRKHDTLLFYSKTPKYFFKPQTEKSYNRGFKPYRFKGVKEYRDETGWYTMVNMKDVWNIDMVGRTSGERTGYATQKPEALLSRIIESCTREGDVCADFFGGSGTLCAVAEKSGRKWICCDYGDCAIANAHKRMSGLGASFVLMEQCRKEHKESLCDVDILCKVYPMEISDKSIMSIELLSYKIKTGRLAVEDKDAQFIKKLAKKESLQLVDYWSVDFDYDGKVHRPQMTFSRKKGGMETSCHKLGDSFGDVSIRVVDVFGNSTLKVISKNR